MKTGILLYARTNSYRLPGKVLLQVMGRPILSYLIERLKTVRQIDSFILCTTKLPEDDVLAELAFREGLACHRGSVDDLIERMLHAARSHEIDFVVSAGSDNIFLDPAHIPLVIEKYRETGADFIYCPDLPLGCSAYAVKTEALEAVHRQHRGKTDHGWDLYFLKDERFRVETVPAAAPEFRRPELRMTMDYPEDFRFFKAILEAIHVPGRMFSLRDVIAFVDAHPEIAALGQKRAEDWQRLRKTFTENIVDTIPKE